MNNWISMEKRLPPFNTLVLCMGAKGGYFLGKTTRGAVCDTNVFMDVPNSRNWRYAIYWTPIPNPPKDSIE